MEQNFQNVAQKVQYDKRLDTFVDKVSHIFNKKSATVLYNYEIWDFLYGETYQVDEDVG